MSAEDVRNAIKDLNDLDDFVKLEAESTISTNMPDELDILHEEVVKPYYPKSIKLSLIDIIKSVKDPSSIDVFGELLHDQNKWVRRQSSSALSEYGDDAVDTLLKLADDKNWRARGGAVWALAKIANKDTLDVFIKASKDERSFVRSGAVFGLGNIGGEEALDILKELSETDESGYVRANALTFIDKLEN
ncbi:MAG: HEAT repeat domain-containing protein [Methanosphaera sp.]